MTFLKMPENQSAPTLAWAPWANFFIIIFFVASGFLAGGLLIGPLVAVAFYPGTIDELLMAVQDPLKYPDVKIAYYIIQGCATFVGLIVVPYFFLKLNQSSIVSFFKTSKVEALPLLLTAFIIIFFMAVDSVVIEWNAEWKFPAFAHDLEVMARNLEEQATKVTSFLTEFESVSQLIIAIIVIAVLPAVGEELVFRGIVQNELFRGTRNIHFAIWFSAILFSAMHFQFFGFVPRMLLGALFGYLYYWSGSLALAMFAHFVNNGISVVALYFYRQGAFDYNLESTEAAPANVVVLSVLVTAGLLFYFYKYFEHRKIARPNL